MKKRSGKRQEVKRTWGGGEEEGKWGEEAEWIAEAAAAAAGEGVPCWSGHLFMNEGTGSIFWLISVAWENNHPSPRLSRKVVIIDILALLFLVSPGACRCNTQACTFLGCLGTAGISFRPARGSNCEVIFIGRWRGRGLRGTVAVFIFFSLNFLKL